MSSSFGDDQSSRSPGRRSPRWVTQIAAPGHSRLERGEPRAEPVLEAKVADPPRRVEAPGELVHDRDDVVDHRLHVLARQEVLDDEEAVFEVVVDLCPGELHGFLLLARGGAGQPVGNVHVRCVVEGDLELERPPERIREPALVARR